MHNPLVSVIIPCYNAERYLAECIDSVLNQTYDTIEIIVVDNNSKDSSLAIAKEYAAKHPQKIKVFEEKWAGASYARNRGFKESTGEYIQFLDADDTIAKNKIKQQLNAFTSDVDVMVSDYGIYNEYLNDLKNIKTFQSIETNPLETAVCSIITTCNPLYKRKIIQENGLYDVSLSSSQDWEFHIRLALNGAKFKYLSGEFFHYRKHSESLSSNWVDVYKVAITIIESYAEQIKSSNMYNAFTGKHIASIYFLTCIYSKDCNVDSTLNAITFWDDNRFSFIVHPLKKLWAKTLGLKSLIKLERYFH
jgi:glycosyltransferase involved in cell wall biosynthesis